jgi:hypothetical protein
MAGLHGGVPINRTFHGTLELVNHAILWPAWLMPSSHDVADSCTIIKDTEPSALVEMMGWI